MGQSKKHLPPVSKRRRPRGLFVVLVACSGWMSHLNRNLKKLKPPDTHTMPVPAILFAPVSPVPVTAILFAHVVITGLNLVDPAGVPDEERQGLGYRFCAVAPEPGFWSTIL